MKKLIDPPLHQQLTQYRMTYANQSGNVEDADLDLVCIDKFIDFTRQYRTQLVADCFHKGVLTNQYEDFLNHNGVRQEQIHHNVQAVKDFLLNFELGDGRLPMLQPESHNNRSTLPEHLPPKSDE